MQTEFGGARSRDQNETFRIDNIFKKDKVIIGKQNMTNFSWYIWRVLLEWVFQMFQPLKQ